MGHIRGCVRSVYARMDRVDLWLPLLGRNPPNNVRRLSDAHLDDRDVVLRG